MGFLKYLYEKQHCIDLTEAQANIVYSVFHRELIFANSCIKTVLCQNSSDINIRYFFTPGSHGLSFRQLTFFFFLALMKTCLCSFLFLYGLLLKCVFCVQNAPDQDISSKGHREQTGPKRGGLRNQSGRSTEQPLHLT